MEILDATILGVVEGLTEFLPVSSTGHMIVTSAFLGVEQSEVNKAFEVVIQLAAILAVAVRYRARITWAQRALWFRVGLAFLPAAVIGLIFHEQVKAMFSVPVVATMFIVGGIVFLILEHFYREDSAHVTSVDQMSYKQAFWIGIAQVFSMIPGTSRAGATITGALLVGLDRKTSAEFSFLLAVPIMLAASGLDFLKNYEAFTNPAMLAPLAAGFVAAFITALLAIRLFIAFLSRFTFVPFGIYRILFGAALLAWFYL